MRLHLLAMPLCLAIAALPLAAQTEAEAEQALSVREGQQRERIGRSRAEIDAQFRAGEVACYQRFAVNDCLIESRRTERELLADLRRQEILINDARRKRRAAEQLLRADERLHGTGKP